MWTLNYIVNYPKGKEEHHDELLCAKTLEAVSEAIEAIMADTVGPTSFVFTVVTPNAVIEHKK